MKLKILTPEKVVLDETVETIQAKAVDGAFGVLNKHIPMITPLDIAVLTYTLTGDGNDEKKPVAVMGGLFQTDGDEAIVLTDAAELVSDIDALRAQQAKERAEARLREKTEKVDVQRAEMSLARALVRLQASKL